MFAKVLPPVLALVGAAALTAEPEGPKAVPPPDAPESAEAPAPAPDRPAADEDSPASDEPAANAEAPQTEAAAERDPAPRKPFSPNGAVQLLGHDDYKTRFAAQQELLTWGSENLDEGISFLHDVYRSTDDPEVRMRSRQVLRRLVILKQPFEGSGYLGIQMDNRNRHHARNKDGELQPAVLVTLVREGTAAEDAKLQDNDLIIGVDKVVFDGLASANETLQNYIMAKSPGDKITLHVRRGEETLALTASLRRRSPLLDRPLLDRRDPLGNPLYTLPPQEELDEADFQDWLKAQEAPKSKSAGDGAKSPDPS